MESIQTELVESTLASAVVELFAAYGVGCEREPRPADVGPRSEMGSLVGFRGKGLRGGLAFVAPVELVARTLPVPPKSGRAELQLRDWSAEIANQLLGRLKNKLSSRSIDFDVGTPVCFRGSSIRLSFLPDVQGISLDFTVGPDDVRVYLDCAVAELGDENKNVTPPRIVTEGDVVLF